MIKWTGREIWSESCVSRAPEFARVLSQCVCVFVSENASVGDANHNIITL
jgi:hypothetical protein